MTNIQILRVNNISISKEKQIIELVSNVFGILNLPKIDLHYQVTISNKLIGYCAISKRIIDIDEKEVNINLLGLFCIKNVNQRSGIGSKLLEFVKNDVYTINNFGIILNCGNSIKHFYLKNGFSEISDKARYVRNEKIETDNDPVLYYGNKISRKEHSVVNLREDF